MGAFMKNLRKLIGIIFVAAIIVCAMTACDDLFGSLNNNDQTDDTYKPVVFTSYDTDDTKYELTITRPSGRAVLELTPKAGDSYTLTITTTTGEAYTSTGQIAVVSGTTFTLKHAGTGNTFSVTVSANSSSGGTIFSVTGDIPINNSPTKLPAPDELLPSAPSGGNDTWSKVTSFSQVNGSWKAQPSYSSTLQGMTLSSTTDNYIITFNAALKTMSVSGSATTTISGGNIDELWPNLKESLGNQGVGTATFNDANHSYTITYNNVIMALTDSELTQMGLQINQDGSKLKMAMDGGIEVIYTRQSSTIPSAPDVNLTGTTWKGEMEDIVESEGYSTGETYEIRGTYTMILKFTTASAWTMDQKLVKETGGEESYSTNGTYVVSGDVVILYGDEMPASGLAGMVSGDTLVLSGIITFYKQ